LASGPGEEEQDGTEDLETIIWDIATRTKLRSLTGFTEWSQIIGFNSESRLLALMGLDKRPR